MGALLREPSTAAPTRVLGYTAVATKGWSVTVPIGASGAVGTLAGPYPSGLAIVKNTTGIYDCTGLPTCAGDGRFLFTLYSPALTVADCVATAFNAASGTMTFKTVLGSATPVQPASGDKIWIKFEGEDG